MSDEIGKRIGGVVYVHRSAIALLSAASSRALSDAAERTGGFEWNVVKIGKGVVTFLLYESFDETAFPALLESLRVTGGRHPVRTDFRKRANPPILHRKELLLSADDPCQPKFRALTAAAEEHGLFTDNHAIGTREVWQKRIADAGLVLKGHALLAAHEDHVDVARHKTAIVRGELSQPMRLMMRLGMVASGWSIFDYGCGQGDDVAALKSEGYDAFGWDPHHATEGRRQPADAVNLGFVINVIDDPKERIETLKAAWGFAKKALCVSVMLQGRISTRGQRPHRDGFLTSRGTFQRYFVQQELRELVASATGQTPLSLAPGIVAAFRDKDLEQEILLRRRSRAFVQGGPSPRPPVRERLVVVKPTLKERLAPVLEVLREQAILLGRLPDSEEVPPQVRSALTEMRIAWERAADALHETLSENAAFADAGGTRREDLLVHIALQQFPGSPKYRSLPRSLQTDIKTFFGSLGNATAEATKLLFAAGDKAGVRADAEAAVGAGLGGWRGKRFRFASSTLPRLPARLRVLVGCAEVLQGGAIGCDFVDVDTETSRVTMITCDNAEQPVPFVVEKLRVDLGRLKVFASRREPETSPIYFKSRFLPRDHSGLDRQIVFEKELESSGLFVEGGPEPKWIDVNAALSRRR